MPGQNKDRRRNRYAGLMHEDLATCEPRIGSLNKPHREKKPKTESRFIAILIGELPDQMLV